MEHRFNTLLEKAKAAYLNWVKGAPMPKGFSADMEELGLAIRDAEATKPLPSNLDEAAEEWCKTNNKGIALSADKKSHYLAEGKDAFKAGVEWMARQGQTIETIVWRDEDGKLYIEEFIDKNKFKKGCSVIIQVRERQ